MRRVLCLSYRLATSFQRQSLIASRPPVWTPAQVGCSSWAVARRTLANGPKETDSNEGAEFMDEVELDEAEWEGEEVSEGVFISTPGSAAEDPTGVAAAGAPSAAGPPRRPSRTSIKHLNRLLSRHQSPDIPESELEERFVRGRGPGGQAINKTNSSVSLVHLPTGIRIQSQPTRSREQNRIIARKILRERLDLMRVRGELEGAEVFAPSSEMSRKEKLAAEARSFSKQELRWEKERRRKLNRKKKVKKRERSESEVGDAKGEDD